MNSKIILTRKQLWRRYKITSINKYIDKIENVIDIIKHKINNKYHLKKVRFSEITYLTLIPTREELNKLDRYYNSHLNF